MDVSAVFGVRFSRGLPQFPRYIFGEQGGMIMLPGLVASRHHRFQQRLYGAVVLVAQFPQRRVDAPFKLQRRADLGAGLIGCSPSQFQLNSLVRIMHVRIVDLRQK